MAQRMMSVYLTQEQFVALLEDLVQRVKAGDSYEGTVEYAFPWDERMGDPETDPQGPGYRVLARYRVGNLQGQGGMHVAGEMREVVE